MCACSQTHLVHDLVPVLAGEDLEDGEHGDGEGVEVGGRDAVGEAEGAAEELHDSHNCHYMVAIVTGGHICHMLSHLHAEEGGDQDEEEEQQQQRDDRLHRGDQRHQQVAQRRPVPARRERQQNTCGKWCARSCENFVPAVLPSFCLALPTSLWPSEDQSTTNSRLFIAYGSGSEQKRQIIFSASRDGRVCE